MNKFIKLIDLLKNVNEYSWSDALFLPQNEEWKIDTRGAILDPDDVEDDNDEVPKFAEDNNLKYALSIQIIQDIADNLLQQKSNCSSEQLFEAFMYFYENDAFIVS